MTTLNQQGAKWLESRGIDLELAVNEGLHSSAPAGGELKPHDDGRWISFPYFRDGNRVGCKHRYTVEKGFQQDKGSDQCLYRYDRLKGAKTIVLCEGEMDALTAVQAGFAATSVPGGAPGQVGKKTHTYLYEAKEIFENAERVIVAVDADEPGRNLFEDTLVCLGRAKCHYVVYPDDCKDLNDVLVKHGVEKVEQVIEGARYVPVDGLYNLDDIPDEPPLQVFRVGLSRDFDHHVGIVRGHTSIWTGFANHGKSLLLKQVATALAKNHGWVIAGAFMEDNYGVSFKGDILGAWSGYHHSLATNEQRAEFKQFMRDQFFVIRAPEDEPVTLEFLFDLVETAVIRHGADFIVIDPFTEIDLQLSRGENERDVIGQALNAFNRVARRYNVHIAIVAHPTKPSEKNEKTAPKGYDISGSAHWKNKPYLGVSVHKDPDVEGFSQVHVWKSKRAEEMGPCGQFYLRYDNAIPKFWPATQAEYDSQRVGVGTLELVDERGAA